MGNAYPIRAIKRYLDAQGPNWATVIAWNAFFAFFPITILVVTVLGLLLRDPGIRQGIEQQVAGAFPDCTRASGCSIIEALDSFRNSAGIFAIIGIVGLFWGGSSLFGAIDQGLDSLYPCKPRDLIPQKLMSFGMILLFCVLAVPLVLSGSLLSAVQSLPAAPDFLRSGAAGILIQLTAGTVDATLLFTAIYFVVPNRPQRLRQVLPGAFASGVLFELFTLVFPLYFSLSSGTAQWGKTFTFIFLLLFYFFILGQIVMLGGAINAELNPGPGPGRPTGLRAGGLTGEGVICDRAISPNEEDLEVILRLPDAGRRPIPEPRR